MIICQHDRDLWHGREILQGQRILQGQGVVLAEEGEVEAGFVQITIAYAQDNEEDPKETYIITDVPEEQMEQLYEMLPPAHPQHPTSSEPGTTTSLSQPCQNR